jgi:hypothetical protein
LREIEVLQLPGLLATVMKSDYGDDRSDLPCPISTFAVDSFGKDIEIEGADGEEVTEEASENEDDNTYEPTNENGHPQEKQERQQQQCRPDRHPHAFKKRTSHSTQQKQSRQRFILFLLSCLTTFFFVGAALAFGPMQLMVGDASRRMTMTDSPRHTST